MNVGLTSLRSHAVCQTQTKQLFHSSTSTARRDFSEDTFIRLIWTEIGLFCLGPSSLCVFISLEHFVSPVFSNFSEVEMRNLWLVVLVGLATGFFTEKILVSSQLPSALDDLYLEGRTSGDLPIDDEDGEDDGSGSGSGDYVYNTEEAELLKFLNFSKPPLGRDIVPVEPLQPQPTAGSPHFGPTSAAENPEPSTTVRDSAPKAPTARDNDEEVVDLGPTIDRTTQATSPVPPSYTTTFGNSIEPDIEEEAIIDDFNIPETGIQNDILTKDGRGDRIYEMDSPKEVTSENMWERTDVLAAIIACGVVGFLCAVFLLLLLAYRMKKKDEGSYDLGETKLTNTAYHKAPTKEFYA